MFSAFSRTDQNCPFRNTHDSNPGRHGTHPPSYRPPSSQSSQGPPGNPKDARAARAVLPLPQPPRLLPRLAARVGGRRSQALARGACARWLLLAPRTASIPRQRRLPLLQALPGHLGARRRPSRGAQAALPALRVPPRPRMRAPPPSPGYRRLCHADYRCCQ